MKTIADAIRQLRNTADILMDRSERERLRGSHDLSLRSSADALAYRQAASYLEAEMLRKVPDAADD